MEKLDEVCIETIQLEEKSNKGTPSGRSVSSNAFSASTDSDMPVSESKGDSSPVRIPTASSDKPVVKQLSSPKAAITAAHWSTTATGSLVARITCYLYKKLLVPPLKDFFVSHCHHFAADAPGGYPLHCMKLYREYEKLIESVVLVPFAEEEGSSMEDIMSAIEEAINNRSVERNFELMLRATSFEKFATLMQLKYKQLQLEADAKDRTGKYRADFNKRSNIANISNKGDTKDENK